MRRLWRIAIRDVKTEVRQLQRFLSTRNSFALDAVGRRSQPGGIEQPDRHAAQVYRLFDGVASGAMRVADDHPVVAEKPVEQTRFTCIRGPVNHHPHAFAQDPALIGGGEQRGNSIANRIEP